MPKVLPTSVLVPGIVRLDPRLKDNSVLWRYLDVGRLLDLLRTRSLYFVRGDQLEDKFEGALTNSIREAIQKAYKDNNIEFTYGEFKRRLRERVFLNCWHMSPDDSMAMWRIYGRSTSAVAITTTVSRLRNAIDSANIPHPLASAKIRYVKHWRNLKLIIKPYSNVFAYKVKAYDFEKEVRVIIDRYAENYDGQIAETGMSVKVPLGKLLRSNVVAPESSPSFLASVNDLAAKYNLDVPVRRSKLTEEPV